MVDEKEILRRWYVKIGRKGGLKGGPARKKKLTPDQRKRIARQAVNARWAKARRKKSSPKNDKTN